MAARSMTRRAILLSTILLAGCVSAPTGDVAPPPSDAGAMLLGAESGLPTEPRTTVTLEEPPAWRLGEWWRIEFDAAPYAIEADFTQVVAGLEGNSYLVGFGSESFDDGVLLLHVPGFGEVNQTTLGFDAHDRPIVPLQFPLREGATWETQWYSGAALSARVTRVEGNQADVELTGARTIHLTYDADIGAIRRLEIVDYGHYEVVDHGFGFNGTVRIPAHQDLVFCHGRATVIQAVDLCVTMEATDPQAPTQSVVLRGGYDRVSFGLFLRDLAEAPVAPGVLHIEVGSPDGGTYEATKTPDSPGMVLYPYGLDDPTGRWDITAVAAGQGLAILEGVAYQVIDVELEA